MWQTLKRNEQDKPLFFASKAEVDRNKIIFIMPFYETIPQKDDYTDKVKNQDDIILDIFKSKPFDLFTPPEIHSMVNATWPLTSTRRTMTDLTASGHLEKTDLMKQGAYGKPNYLWRLKNNRHEQRRLF